MNLIRQIDPSLLASFVAVVDGGNLAMAAQSVGRTVSAVSQQMKRLEDSLGGLPLFEASGRGKRLTAHGEVLLAHARHILVLNERVWSSMARLHAGRLVRLGAPDDYSASLLPRALDQVAAAHPDAQIELICEPSQSLRRMVRADMLDLAIITRQPGEADVETLRREPLVWVSDPAARWREHKVMPLSLFQPGCLARSMALEAFDRTGRPYRIICSSPSVTGVLTAIRAGSAIGAVALCSAPHDVEVLEPTEEIPGLPTLEIGLLEGPRAREDELVRRVGDELRLALAA
jgi:DNA-binding transcriptional LysR family regulator